MIVRHKLDSQGYPYTEGVDHDKDGQPMAFKIPGTRSQADVSMILKWCRHNDRNKERA